MSTARNKIPYKVIAIAARPEELMHVPERGAIWAIVGINLRHGQLNEAAESVRLLRSLLPHGSKVVLTYRENDKKQLGNALIAWAMLTAIDMEAELGLAPAEQGQTPRHTGLLVKALADLQA